MVEVYDFASVQDKTNVREAIHVYDNTEQSKNCLSLLSDGTKLIEKEKIVNPGKLNIK